MAALAAQVVLGGALIFAAVNGFAVIGGAGHDRSGAAANGSQPRARTAADRFDGARAFAWLRAQVAVGPRPAGSPASRRLAQRLRRALPHGRFEFVPGGLRNVVGYLPGAGPAVLVAAHYDTKDISGFVGANDGAGGTAAVLELARELSHMKRRRGAPQLRFVLFDGEESPRGSPDSAFVRDGLRGSRAYARRHARELRAMVLLDFIAQPGLTLEREAGSNAALWARLRAAARRAGVAGRFPPGQTGPVYDDHTPFAGAGIPAVDLIDFDYACFHRTCDDLRHVSPGSLDAAGEAVLELLRGF